MARAALVAGAQGIMVEVHPHPEKALCDGQQSLSFPMFAQLMRELRAIEEALRSAGALRPADSEVPRPEAVYYAT
jgi:3-deoxy-D-arabino-heptulosonate 7-phosphate (DAHP) synthase